MSDTPALLAQLKDQRAATSHRIGERKREGLSAQDLIEQCKVLTERIEALERHSSGNGARPDVSSLTCSVATTPGRLAALRSEWQALADVCPAANPFTTWEWADGWYGAYRHLGQQMCLQVRDGSGRLLGVAPLFLAERSDGRIKPGQFCFAGTFGRLWAYYPEVLTQPGHETDVTDTMLRYLHRQCEPWQALRLIRACADSPTVARLAGQAVRYGCRAYFQPELTSCVGDLPDDPEAVVATLPSRKFRHNYRAAERHFASRFPRAEFRMVSDHDDLDRTLREVSDYSHRRWNGHSRGSNFSDATFTSALATVMHNYLNSGLLRLLVLENDGELVAAVVNILHRGCLYIIQPAANPAYLEYGPNHLVQIEAIRRAVAEGGRHCDFMASQPYKTRYLSGQRHLVDVSIVPDSPAATWDVARQLTARALTLSVKKLLRPPDEA